MFGRSVRTSQPQGPARIDWSNPITRGLVRAVNSASINDACGSGIPMPQGTMLSRSGKISFSSGSSLELSDAPLLTFTLFSLATVPASGTFGLLTRHGSPGGPQNYGLFHEAGFPRLGVRNTSSSYIYQSSSIAPVAGSNCAYCGSYDGASLRVYTNGVLGGTLAASLINNGAGQITQIGAFDGASRAGSFTTHGISLSLIFTRALSDAEIKSLSDNPWQIFAPDSKSIWIPAAASVTLPTLVQPSSTTSAGAWTATGAASLHAAINELVPSDTQYISVNSASTTELVLAESAHPGAANQTLAYRASSTQGSTLTVTLKQGATQIMTRTHALTGIDTLYTQTLTAGEISLITAGPISVTLTTS